MPRTARTPAGAHRSRRLTVELARRTAGGVVRPHAHDAFEPGRLTRWRGMRRARRWSSACALTEQLRGPSRSPSRVARLLRCRTRTRLVSRRGHRKSGGGDFCSRAPSCVASMQCCCWAAVKSTWAMPTPRVSLFGERLRAQLGLDTARERAHEMRDLLAAVIGGTDEFCATGWRAASVSRRAVDLAGAPRGRCRRPPVSARVSGLPRSRMRRAPPVSPSPGPRPRRPPCCPSGVGQRLRQPGDMPPTSSSPVHAGF